MSLKELEGCYFVFNFQADYTEESSVAILQVEKGKLVEKFHPCEQKGVPYDCIGRYTNELAVRYLKKHKIDTVYSLALIWPDTLPNEFLGHTLQSSYINEDLIKQGSSKRDAENWFCYSATKDEYWQGFFERENIKLKLIKLEDAVS
ncbi:MAG: hypothetical protein PHC66_03265 [Candidatus Nanoarchaeia archaeon]|nr:hypothetical protein [Candidatus Nanoarchaeia archaeon]MDD5239860.1 hypothetical protein [Candidatus Nanoarchaeia archaeon]